ncbi:hypothetical protein [Prevotella sp. S7 MS 2]|uniref:hypothetical protein n=1 Tax=Prevotella sp. S7 MS 2 TaxID=1287488 RepID=UPI000512F458|nr:hypothetical protein [Prevotella sp. S7 MS 2]KGI59780.1 hypothetical protein HMPREF0671_09645 [Prevotella sp. S7 MS 2]
MKKFLISFILTVAFIVVADQAIGYMLKRGYDFTTFGAIGRKNEIVNYVKSDIVILGSSRALHHYVPPIISDSTGLSCYNCGLGGQGIIYHYALLRAMSQRYIPKMIIYELTPEYDIEPSNNARFLTEIRTLSPHGCADSILSVVGHMERMKMLSGIYPYNSLLFHIVGDRLQHKDLISQNGYIPMKGSLKKDENYQPRVLDFSKIDSVKVSFFEKMLREYSKKTKLIVMVSPIYGSNAPASFDVIERLCARYDVAFHNCSGDQRFTHAPSLYSDHVHFNDSGARQYTAGVCKYFRP